MVAWSAIYELTGPSAKAPINSRFFGVISSGMTCVQMRYPALASPNEHNKSGCCLAIDVSTAA